MDAAALVDDSVAMIDQQLQLPVALLVRARAAQGRLTQGRSGDRERVDRIRLATPSAGAPRGAD